MPLRVSAIDFLNPAPLLYDFEHEPGRRRLRERYRVQYTSPARCAQELASGGADLGLVPIAALTPELLIVPGCTIASLAEVRSILLLVKNPRHASRFEALQGVRSLAADSASRSSVAYAGVLFQHFTGQQPTMHEQQANAISMLHTCDAALLIGDPALLARERRQAIESHVEVPLLWLDIAALWREVTGLPWVAAVWAVLREGLTKSGISGAELTSDLNASRDAGLQHVDDLVEEWTPRLALPPGVIRTYLTRNIHYRLDSECLQAIVRFRHLAADAGLLPPLPELHIL